MSQRTLRAATRKSDHIAKRREPEISKEPESPGALGVGCPFCGSWIIALLLKAHWYMRCEECGAKGPRRSTRDEAVGAWNGRAE